MCRAVLSGVWGDSIEEESLSSVCLEEYKPGRESASALLAKATSLLVPWRLAALGAALERDGAVQTLVSQGCLRLELGPSRVSLVFFQEEVPVMIYLDRQTGHPVVRSPG